MDLNNQHLRCKPTALLIDQQYLLQRELLSLLNSWAVLRKKVVQKNEWKFGGDEVHLLVLKSIFSRNDVVLKMFCKKGNWKNSGKGVLFKKKL